MAREPMGTCPVSGNRCSCTGHCNIEALQKKTPLTKPPRATA